MRIHRFLLRAVAATALVTALSTPAQVVAVPIAVPTCDFSLSKITTNSTSATGTVKSGASLLVTCTVSLGPGACANTEVDLKCGVVLSVNGVTNQTKNFFPEQFTPSSSRTFTFQTTVTQPVGSTVTYTCEVNPVLANGERSVMEGNVSNNRLSTSLKVVP